MREYMLNQSRALYLNSISPNFALSSIYNFCCLASRQFDVFEPDRSVLQSPICRLKFISNVHFFLEPRLSKSCRLATVSLSFFERSPPRF